MKKTMLKRMIVSLLTVSMCMMSALSSLAATPEEIEKSRITNLLPASEAPRSLTVTVSVPAESQSSGETTQKIEGAEISIYKIADMKLEGEFAQYLPSAGFEEADASAGLDADAFDGMTAAESQTASKLLANEIRTRGLTPTAGPVTTGADGSAVFSDLEDGMYLIMQTGSEAGSKASLYEYFDPQMALVPGFGLNEDGSLNGGDPIYNVMAFLKTELISKPSAEIFKVDVNGKPIMGAIMQIYLVNSDGSLTPQGDPWETSEEPKLFYGEVGQKYIVRELKAPSDGYDLASDIAFEFESEMTGQKIIVRVVDLYSMQATVTVKKSDAETGEALAGAELQIIEVVDGNETVVDSWISDGTPHIYHAMNFGKYILREISAPAGYALAEDQTFTLAQDLNEQGLTLDVKDPYNVAIEKVDENGDALKGATLQLFDTSGTAVGDKWVTDGNPHAMKLTPGTEYILKELAAPAGYQKAQDVTFTCYMDGNKMPVQKIKMVDKRIAATPTPTATPTVAPPKPAPKPVRTVVARTVTKVVKAVKTGDYRTLLPYIMAIAVSAGVIVVLIRKRRKS